MTSTATATVHAPIARQLETLLEGVAASFGYEIVVLEWLSGKGQVLRIYLDGPDGINVDGCAKMSRMFSQVLDGAETSGEHPEIARALSRPYQLEVSSPGLERPLRKLAHFQAYLGRKASFQTRVSPDPVSGRKKFTAVIESTAPGAANDDPYAGTVVVLDCDTQEHFNIELGDIRRANLVYEA